jgi:hypothetical protein
MKLSMKIAGLTCLVAGAVSTANAGCVAADWMGATNATSDFHSVVYRPGSDDASLRRVGNRGSEAAIVGLWKFEMIAASTPLNKNPMPDGTLIDFGTAVWHADGTEFQTSGIRNPSDGDVCQGVWAQIGASTFQLNHYALAWTNGAYTGPANIRAVVKVDSTGDRYTGGFQTDVYLASVTPGHEFDKTTKLVTITGTFTATRVTINN